MKHLHDLIREKATVDSKIRAHRVNAIRRVLVNRSSVQNKDLKQLIDRMETSVTMVHYCHHDFDELLEQIETKLGF